MCPCGRLLLPTVLWLCFALLWCGAVSQSDAAAGDAAADDDWCIAGASAELKAACSCSRTGGHCDNHSGLHLTCTGLHMDVLNQTTSSQESPHEIFCLVIRDSNFPTLSRTHLLGFPDIFGLVIERSRLSNVKPNAVEGLTHLEYMRFSDNELTTVPRLTRQNQLSILDLSDNMISSLDNTSLSSLSSIQTLVLAGNRIEELRGRIFVENNCELLEADFSRNPIRVVENNFFDHTDIRQLRLSDTKISKLPDSQHFRERIQEIFLTGTKTFRTFHALSQTPGDTLSNKTYPLLRTLHSPYHAHCCQLKNLNYQYQDLPSIPDGTPDFGGLLGNTTETTPPTISPDNTTHSAPATAATIVTTFCLDTASMTCTRNTSAPGNPPDNPSDPLDNSLTTEIAVFCTQVLTMGLCSAQCVQETCPNCAIFGGGGFGGGFGGGGGGSGDAVGGDPPPLLCLEQEQELTPTTTSSTSPSSPSSSSSSFPPSIGTTTTRVRQTLCCAPTPTPIATPTPDDSPPPAECASVTQETVECTLTGTALICSVEYCHEAPLTCALCRESRCGPIILPPGFDCFEEYPTQCQCWDHLDHCCPDHPFFGRKRSLRDVEGNQLLQPLDAEGGESRASSTRKRRRERGERREKREVGTSSCVLDPLDEFPASIEGIPGLVPCRKLNATNSTPPSSPPLTDQGCSPYRGFLEYTVEVGPVTCLPGDDAFNPCEDLLGESDYLRGFIWTVVVLACLGNGLVLLVFVGYSVIIRRTKQDFFVVHFLYFNLALADFLMGIYLFIVAVKDASSRGGFFHTDISWRQGHACSFAGFCAITSTVVSVYILMVVTLERTYTILRVFKHRRLTKRKALVVVLVGWALGLLVATLPLVYFSDYSSVAICLPFNISGKEDLAYVVILLLGTGLAFVVIAICYALILQQIICSRRKNRPYTESKNKLLGEVKVAVRIFVLVLTNFACWFPIALVSLAAVFDKSLVRNIEFARWAIVFFFPINACLNPILYSITTRAFRDNLVLLLSQCGLCKKRAQHIRNAQVGLTPSWTSRTSDTSGILRVRNTVVTRFRSMSLASQASMVDLLSRFNQRRESTISQASDENNLRAHALNHGRRRSSAYSNESARDQLGRSRSDSTFSADSDEAAVTTFLNAGFRTGSPEGNRPHERVDLRARVKVSASSLGALPEEVENPVDVVVGEENVVKVNPAYCEDEDQAEEGEGEGEEKVEASKCSDDSQRDSGVIDGSDNGSGEVEVIAEPPAYKLNMEDEDPAES